ncbi:MAG TPA: hypothetical protein PK733_18310, partial [Clostridiales bacterium]|nr:hypothetical protein [Clostridiales bacterium]
FCKVYYSHNNQQPVFTCLVMFAHSINIITPWVIIASSVGTGKITALLKQSGCGTLCRVTPENMCKSLVHQCSFPSGLLIFYIAAINILSTGWL